MLKVNCFYFNIRDQ